MPPKLVIEVLGDTSHFERSFNRASRSSQGFTRNIGQASRGAVAASLSFRGLGRSIGLVSAGFLGGAGFVTVAKSAVSAASNLAEQTAKSSVVFGESAASVEAWSKTTVNAMGLAQDQALETASSFGALLRPLGLTGDAAAKQSTRLTKLGADLASFYNTSVSDALAAVRSGLVGESEPLRRYGVLLTEARVASEAMAQTGKTNVKQLTAGEKVLARQAIILKDAAQAQGDFARTSGGLANQQRILSANVRQLQIGIGNALIPDVLKITQGLNDWLGKSENQRRVTDALRGAVKTLHDIISAIVPTVRLAADAARQFASSVGGAKNAVGLLLAAVAAVKLAGLISSLRLIGVEAGGAATKVGLLSTRLGILSRIGPIGIALTIAIQNQDAIDKWFEDHGLGVLNTKVSGKNTKFSEQRARAFAKAGFPISPSRIATVEAGAGTLATSIIESARSGFQRQADRMFGTSGAGAAGRRPLPIPKALGLDKLLGNQIALAEARARSEAQQRTVFGEKLAIINKRLRGRLAVDDRIALEAEKTSILSGLKSMNDAEAADRKSASDRAAAAAKSAAAKASAAAKKAITDRAKAVIAGMSLHGRSLGVKGGLSLADVNKALAGREQAAQFRALGLTSAGEALAPTGEALGRRASQISEALKGTVLDTDKNRNVIARVRKVLTEQFGALTRETRLAMKGLLDAISGTLGESGKLNKIRAVSTRRLAEQLTAGLNVDAATKRGLQFNIAGAHLTTGGGRMDIHTNVNLDGRQVGRSVQRDAARTAHRTAKQTSGWQGG